MADLSHIPVLVPDHVTDASTLLPMGSSTPRREPPRCDLVDAVRGAVPGKRYAAWAELAYQWARPGVEKAEPGDVPRTTPSTRSSTPWGGTAGGARGPYAGRRTRRAATPPAGSSESP
jgi:hypothetical protein